MIADPWKFAIAASIGFALAAGLSGSQAMRTQSLAIIAFAAFGVINALIGFRSMSGVALLTAIFLAVSLVLARRRWSARPHSMRVVVGIAMYGAAALTIYIGLNAAAAANLLGDAAKAKFDAQSGVVEPSAPATTSPSNSGDRSPSGGSPAVPGASSTLGLAIPPGNALGPVVGGRAEFQASTQAILDSPILGHGSWARGPKYAALQRERLLQAGVPLGNLPTDPTLIPTHSYLLGSWVWAGAAGGLFWIAVAVFALWVVANLYAVALAIAPLIAFVVSLLLWSIAFSPYSNTERIYAAFAIVVCVLGYRLIRAREERRDYVMRSADHAEPISGPLER
jgi:hypothetical protein